MKTGVLFVHGIGHHQTDGPQRLHQGILRELRVRPEADITWAAAHWWRVTQERQEHLLQRLEPYRLGWPRLRRTVVGTVADAIAYQRPYDRDGSSYFGIHAVLSHAYESLGKVDRLLVVAHSLGTIIATNWLYDQFTDQPQPTISLVTMGSPLALWALQYPDGGAPQCLNWWLNIYDRRDPIATPLRPVGAAWQLAVDEDYAVCNTWLWPYLPASHTGYWDNPQVARRIAAHLAPLPRETSWWQRSLRKGRLWTTQIVPVRNTASRQPD